MPLNGFLCAVNPATQQVFVVTEDARCPASIAGYGTPLANNEAPGVVITLPVTVLSQDWLEKYPTSYPKGVLRLQLRNPWPAPSMPATT